MLDRPCSTATESAGRGGGNPETLRGGGLNPSTKPCTLHPTPYTLHTTLCSLHPTSYTLHLIPSTPHPTPYVSFGRAGSGVKRRGGVHGGGGAERVEVVLSGCSFGECCGALLGLRTYGSFDCGVNGSG